MLVLLRLAVRPASLCSGCATECSRPPCAGCTRPSGSCWSRSRHRALRSASLLPLREFPLALATVSTGPVAAMPRSCGKSTKGSSIFSPPHSLARHAVPSPPPTVSSLSSSCSVPSQATDWLEGILRALLLGPSGATLLEALCPLAFAYPGRLTNNDPPSTACHAASGGHPAGLLDGPLIVSPFSPALPSAYGPLGDVVIVAPDGEGSGAVGPGHGVSGSECSAGDETASTATTCPADGPTDVASIAAASSTEHPGADSVAGSVATPSQLSASTASPASEQLLMSGNRQAGAGGLNDSEAANTGGVDHSGSGDDTGSDSDSEQPSPPMQQPPPTQQPPPSQQPQSRAGTQHTSGVRQRGRGGADSGSSAAVIAAWAIADPVRVEEDERALWRREAARWQAIMAAAATACTGHGRGKGRGGASNLSGEEVEEAVERAAEAKDDALEDGSMHRAAALYVLLVWRQMAGEGREGGERGIESGMDTGREAMSIVLAYGRRAVHLFRSWELLFETEPRRARAQHGPSQGGVMTRSTPRRGDWRGREKHVPSTTASLPALNAPPTPPPLSYAPMPPQLDAILQTRPLRPVFARLALSLLEGPLADRAAPLRRLLALLPFAGGFAGGRNSGALVASCAGPLRPWGTVSRAGKGARGEAAMWVVSERTSQCAAIRVCAALVAVVCDARHCNTSDLRLVDSLTTAAMSPSVISLWTLAPCAGRAHGPASPRSGLPPPPLSPALPRARLPYLPRPPHLLRSCCAFLTRVRSFSLTPAPAPFASQRASPLRPRCHGRGHRLPPMRRLLHWPSCSSQRPLYRAATGARRAAHRMAERSRLSCALTSGGLRCMSVDMRGGGRGPGRGKERGRGGRERARSACLGRMTAAGHANRAMSAGSK